MFIVSIVLFIYLIFGEPLIERIQYVKFFKSWETDIQARIRLYKQAFFRNWALGGLIIVAAWISDTPFSALGFRHVNFQLFYSYPTLIQIIILLSVLGYLFYFYFLAIFGIHLNHNIREYVIKKIKPMQHLAPRTKSEYFWWVANALTAAIEELLYRGFIFFFLPIVFPKISILLIASISIFLDALRYVPRLSAMCFVASTGVIFTISFIIFDSLFPAMFLHIIHDLRALAVPFYLVKQDTNPSHKSCMVSQGMNNNG